MTARQPKGTPVGGQFAESAHDEAATLPEPEFVPMSESEIDAATDSAVEALLWSSSEVEEFQSENPGLDPELDPASRAWLRDEISDFVEANPALIEAARESGYSATDGSGFEGALGHDFVLTRAGSGTGFWDRDALRKGDIGKLLTEAVQRRRDLDDAYVDDSGIITIDSGYAKEQTRKTDEALDAAIAAGDRSKVSEFSGFDGLYLSYQGRKRLDSALAGGAQ